MSVLLIIFTLFAFLVFSQLSSIPYIFAQPQQNPRTIKQSLKKPASAADTARIPAYSFESAGPRDDAARPSAILDTASKNPYEH